MEFKGCRPFPAWSHFEQIEGGFWPSEIPDLLIQIKAFFLWIAYGYGIDSGVLNGLPHGNPQLQNPIRRQEMKLNETRWEITTGVAFAILWVICGVIVFIALGGP